MEKRLELKIIDEEAREIEAEANSCLQIMTDSSSEFYYSNGKEIFTRTIALIKRYNQIVKTAKNILKNENQSLLPDEVGIYVDVNLLGIQYLASGSAKQSMKMVQNGAKKLYKITSSLLSEEKPIEKSSSEGQKELERLKKSVSDEIKNDLPMYAKDLTYSIDIFRKDDLLGAALVAGRIIDVLYSKSKAYIASNLGKKYDEITPDDIDIFLEEEALAGSRGPETNVMAAVKLYRNKYSHKVGEYPEFEDYLIVIAGSISLVKLMIKSGLHKKLGL